MPNEAQKPDLTTFRTVAQRVLDADSEMLEFWRNVDASELSEHANAADVQILRKLIFARIHVLPAFGVLSRLDRCLAFDVLISRYVGVPVSPYRKFGGFVFELSTMLDDLCEIHGEQALRDLIATTGFDIGKLGDPNVIQSFCEALDLDDAESFHSWLKADA